MLHLFITLSALSTLGLVLAAPSYPVVLLHGIASSAASLDSLSTWLHDEFHLDVFNVDIGNGERTSLYTSMPQQVDLLCDAIYNTPQLANGFNFIGMSQGGLLARGYVERCNKFPVRNLITLVSPHGGVYLPANLDMYTDFIQSHISIGGYWRDPRDLETYLAKCNFLPILDNEIQASAERKARVKSLHNFVFIWSQNDEVLQPPASGKFSVYDMDLNVIPLEERRIYTEDLIGLKYLNDEERLHVYQTNCTHVEHRDEKCFSQLYPIFERFL